MFKRQRSSELGLAGIGLDLAASVAVGALLGWWIDSRFDTTPWGTLICATIGIVGGLLNFVRSARRVSLREAREARRTADGGSSVEAVGDPPADDSHRGGDADRT